MDSSIDTLINNIDDDYIHPSFKVILENHLPRLKRLSEDQTISVSPMEAKKFDYDYYGLLSYKNIDYRIHWITLRVNGRIDPNAPCSDVTHIKIPPMNEIERLLDFFKTERSK